MPFFGHSSSQVLTPPPIFPSFFIHYLVVFILSTQASGQTLCFFYLKSIWWVRKPVALRGAEGTAGSGFRLVGDAVRDDYNDYDDYECLAVSASLLPTDRINLTFWRRHFTLQLPFLDSSLRLWTLSVNNRRRGTDWGTWSTQKDWLRALEYTEGPTGGPGVHRGTDWGPWSTQRDWLGALEYTEGPTGGPGVYRGTDWGPWSTQRDRLGALEYTEGPTGGHGVHRGTDWGPWSTQRDRLGGPGVDRASGSFTFSHWCWSSYAADGYLLLTELFSSAIAKNNALFFVHYGIGTVTGLRIRRFGVQNLIGARKFDP